MKSSGNQEEDEGHDQLVVSARLHYSVLEFTYLDRYADRDPCHCVLRCIVGFDLVPPLPPGWCTGFEDWTGSKADISFHVSSLSRGDRKKLRMCCLKESDTKGQVDAHDPVLGGTWEESIEDIGNHTQAPVYVKSSNGADCQWNVPNAQEREVSITNQEDTSRKQEASPGYNDGDVGDAESVCVEAKSHVVAISKPILCLSLSRDCIGTIVETINTLRPSASGGRSG